MTTTITFDDGEIEIDITPSDVLTTIGRVDGVDDPSDIPEETVQQKIDDETLIVKAMVPDRIADLAVAEEDAQDALEMLIRRRAARGSWNSTPTAVRKQVLDTAISYEAGTFEQRLANSVEEAEEILGLHTGGTSAAFSDKTTSQFDPAHPEGRWRP